MKDKKAVVIISGGMDSSTLLYDVKQNYDIVGAISFFYGQKHDKELEYAMATCLKLGIEHKILNLPMLKDLLSSTLTNEEPIPEGHYEQENMKQTVVPFRNQIMLSIACGYAVSKNAEIVFYGAHAGDHHIYWDCRPEFIDKLNEVTFLSEPPIKIIAPYRDITKVEILKKGLELGVDYKDTWTCYNGREKACGKCGSCRERLEAFERNGIKDPLEYEQN
jgi:7-cyano-7-deazaguanine synthase